MQVRAANLTSCSYYENMRQHGLFDSSMSNIMSCLWLHVLVFFDIAYVFCYEGFAPTSLRLM